MRSADWPRLDINANWMHDLVSYNAAIRAVTVIYDRSPDPDPSAPSPATPPKFEATPTIAPNAATALALTITAPRSP